MPKNVTTKLPNQPRKQQQPSCLHFMMKTITMPACTMMGRPTAISLTQKSYFFFAVLITLDLLTSKEVACLPCSKSRLKKVKSDTLIFISLLDTT
jgi:hypothetical protein